MSKYKNLESAYQKIQNRILKACQECGRKPDEVCLIAASKAQSIETIQALHELGQESFGENYAQELLTKAPHLPTTIRWIFIGKLQSNKIKSIMTVAGEIQSIASLKQARMVARYAQELNKVPFPIFIAVCAPGDENKGGVSFAELDALKLAITNELPQLALQGIMAIPPARFAEQWCQEAEDLYKHLRLMAKSVGAGKLSLGMSSDLEHAIQCGSDIVRIGSALMGSR